MPSSDDFDARAGEDAERWRARTAPGVQRAHASDTARDARRDSGSAEPPRRTPGVSGSACRPGTPSPSSARPAGRRTRRPSAAADAVLQRRAVPVASPRAISSVRRRGSRRLGGTEAPGRSDRAHLADLASSPVASVIRPIRSTTRPCGGGGRLADPARPRQPCRRSADRRARSPSARTSGSIGRCTSDSRSGRAEARPRSRARAVSTASMSPTGVRTIRRRARRAARPRPRCRCRRATPSAHRSPAHVSRSSGLTRR
jgi:hypothetical protein